MLPLVAKYQALQQADLALAAVTAKLDRLPAQRELLAQRQTAARVPVRQHQDEVAAVTKQSRAVEQELADLADKKKKEQGRTFNVKTQVELNALNREIAALADTIGATEEKGLVLLDELETLRGRLPELQAAQQREETAIAAAQQRLAAEEQVLRAEQARLQADRSAADAHLSDEQREEYLKVAAHRDGVVVAALDPVKFTCGGCIIRVRPQLVEELYNGRLVRCEECQRFLYASEGANDAAESAPGA